MFFVSINVLRDLTTTAIALTYFYGTKPFNVGDGQALSDLFAVAFDSTERPCVAMVTETLEFPLVILDTVAMVTNIHRAL